MSHREHSDTNRAAQSHENGTRPMSSGSKQDDKHCAASCISFSLRSVQRTLLLLTFLLCGTLLHGSARAEQSGVRVAWLETDGQTNPTGIDASAPRFLWKLASDGQERGLIQESYRIVVSSTPDLLRDNRGDVWDSGEVRDRATFRVQFAGRPLLSHRRYFWKVAIKVNGHPAGLERIRRICDRDAPR